MDKDIADDTEDKKEEDKEMDKDFAEDLDDKKEDYMKNLYVNDNFETGETFIMIKSVDTSSNIVCRYLKCTNFYIIFIPSKSLMIIALEEPATEEHSLLSGRFIKVIFLSQKN